MKHPPPLEYGKYYHIYNRGINSCSIFREHSNYEHFMRLYDDYLPPVADTFAWVLMDNHFHFLLRIKTLEEIEFMKSREEKRHIEYPEQKKYNPTHQLGHLFNAYAKAFNKRYDRTGSLFESPFKRLPVEDARYFKALVFYIHNNPVRHRICESMSDYPWSSYLTLISVTQTNLHRDTVLGWFNSRSEFIEYHQQNNDNNLIEGMVIE